MNTIDCEEMDCGEEQEVCDLIEDVFAAQVAPSYSEKGVEEFLRFANAEAMAERVRSGSCVFVAKKAGHLVGALEFAPPNRVALLFVAERGQGIGIKLMTCAIQEAQSRNPLTRKMIVNSSPNAEEAYQKMGFRRSGDATTRNGIRFIPMERQLADRQYGV